MPSTRMFRDRVVSMEQTFEKGEKHLPLLKALVDEAIPGMELEDCVLDHEHDCFVMNYRTAAGAAKKISWTRMVLYDAERIPAIVEDGGAPIRGRLIEFLRKRAERNVIDVTFRHLEEGWVDTPEPRKPKPQPARGKGQPPGPGRPPQGRGPQGKGGEGRPGPPGPRPAAPPRGPRPAPPPAAGPAAAGEPGAPGAPGSGRRRRFRRRRGRRRGGPGSGPATPPAGGAPNS
ncbi:MAG TPA: hypothetical protein VKH46_16825 [Thermoanaerobaculia bacterium]|jgi:hypothetical protein|nr:hypothetical protein [Thermoanaerobaculia bacterium]